MDCFLHEHTNSAVLIGKLNPIITVKLRFSPELFADRFQLIIGNCEFGV
jgi:hypothetical protein